MPFNGGTRNEGRETTVDRIVIVHPKGMAVGPEIPQSLSIVHSFALLSKDRGCTGNR